MAQLAELPSDPNNPIVFFDIHMGGHNIGRIKMELFANVCPKTVENFRYFLKVATIITQHLLIHATQFIVTYTSYAQHAPAHTD